MSEDAKRFVTEFYFGALPESQKTETLGKLSFTSLSEVPDCTKYPKWTGDFEFKRPPALNERMELMTLPIQPILEPCFPFLDLNPARWDLVKKDLSEGWCYVPILDLNGLRDAPNLAQGRHRCAALLRLYGLKEIPFAIEPSHRDILETWLSTQSNH